MRGYESSTALAIYVQNIIKGLKLLPEELKPKVYLFYTETAPLDDVKSISYPYIDYVYVNLNPPYVQLNLIQRIVNRFLTTLGFKPFYKPRKERIDKSIKLDALYPNWISDHQIKVDNPINWIIDFQYIHLPHFFTEEELNVFFAKVKELAHSKERVVVSSEDAKNDFASLHPDYTCDLRVLNFVSGFDYSSVLPDESVLQTYAIDRPYFITPNQFWPHKNHIVILKALKLLVHKGYNFQVVFTGTPTSYRDNDYGAKLATFVEEHNLTTYVKFLGFLPRKDMLNLVRQAQAIVQPSLFEGWSTLVEEAKALNKFIILSDLRVHREQINENCFFFNPENEIELSEFMKTVIDDAPVIKKVDYSVQVQAYSTSLASLFDLKSY